MAVEPVEEHWPGRERLVIDEFDEPTRAIPVADEVTAVAPPPPPGPPVPVDPRGRWISDQIGLGMILLLLVVAVAGAAIAAVLLTRGNDHRGAVTTTIVETTPARVAPAEAAPVAMPSLVGRSRADATAALRADNVKLVVAAVPGRPPADRVVAQAPPAGQRLRPGQAVHLNVSDGGKIAAAPVSTLSTTTAPTQPTAQQTTTAQETTTTSAAQAPPAPPPTVQVPSLTGEVKDAVQQLSSTGLLASLQYVPGDDPLGTVRAQSPPAGATARTASHVTLSVSSGPGDKTAETVPDTSGQTVPQALATLNRAGLRLIMLRRTVTDRSLAGRIVEQTPRAGAQAPTNAQVLVYMGAYRG